MSASAVKRRLRQVTIIGAISLAMTLLVGEVGLRAVGFEAPPLYERDPELGWSLRPNLRTVYRDEGTSLVSTSSAGLRDVEHAVEKKVGVYRIAVLGDSFAEALQVDREESFWALLDENLRGCPARHARDVEVLNFGVSSYGTANELLMLEQRVFAYSPDLVLTAFFGGNDVQDNDPALDHLTVRMRPYFRLESGTLVLQPGEPLGLPRRAWQAALRVSRLGQLVEQIRKRRAQRAARQASGSVTEEAGVARDLFLAGDGAPEWKRAWEVTERLLTRMFQESEQHGARFLLLDVAPSIVVHPDDAARSEFARKVGAEDLFRTEARLTRLASSTRMEFLALGPPMLEHARKTGRCLHGFANAAPCGGHWNQEGHRIASVLVAERICALWGTDRAARDR
jgi:hypothetical protein